MAGWPNGRGIHLLIGFMGVRILHPLLFPSHAEVACQRDLSMGLLSILFCHEADWFRQHADNLWLAGSIPAAATDYLSFGTDCIR